MNSAERELFQEKLDEIQELKAAYDNCHDRFTTAMKERGDALEKAAKLQAELSKAWETCQKAVERGMGFQRENAKLQAEVQSLQWELAAIAAEQARGEQ